MNNEEKVLAMLEEQSKRFDRIDQRLDAMQNDITDIKEEVTVIHTCTDALIEWADRVEHIVKVPLSS